MGRPRKEKLQIQYILNRKVKTVEDMNIVKTLLTKVIFVSLAISATTFILTTSTKKTDVTEQSHNNSETVQLTEEKPVEEDEEVTELTPTVSENPYHDIPANVYYPVDLTSYENLDFFRVHPVELMNNIIAETDTIEDLQFYELQTRLNQLPDEIQDDIAYLPFYISDDENAFVTESGKRYSGEYLCITGRDTDSIRLYYDCITYSVFHEVGHWLYFNCDDITVEDVEDLFAEEYSSLCDNYDNGEHYAESVNEYFAECFEYYVVLPDEMENTMPATYNYIEQILALYK